MTDSIQTYQSPGSVLVDLVPSLDLLKIETKVPLVIDLDGTLCRSDTLHEGILSLIARRPTALLQLPSWLAKGKSAFKRQVADQSVLDPALLPYDSDVLELIRQARAEGRNVALVSAADHRQVEAVAAHLGLFDLSVGTGSPGIEGNLRGKAKADFLVSKFGVQGFDYLGDSATDLPVWKAARQALGARLSPALPRRAAAEGVAIVGIGSPGGWPIRALIKACRPHQWAKNLLILLPVLASQDLAGLPAALLATLCFSLTASAIYIVNDLLDLPSDRVHPRKRDRPFASGSVNAIQGLTAAAGLLMASMVLARLILPMEFLWILLLYLVTTTLYSLSLKRKMMADVIGLAALYTLRIVAGSMATGIVLSPWLLVFSMFLFFALATIKRQAELEDLVLRGKTATEGRNLIVLDLPIYQGMSIAAGQAAVVVFALYSQDGHVQLNFSNPNLLLLICPVLMFWLGRMQLMTRRGFMTDDPIVFTLRDRVSLVCGMLMLVIFLVSALGRWT